MYKLFGKSWIKKYPENNAPSRGSSEKIFHKMGLKIKPLKTDTYKTCDKFQQQISSAKAAADIEIQKKDHWEQTARLREQMKHDFETGKTNRQVQ